MAFGQRFGPEVRKGRGIAAADKVAVVREHEKAFPDFVNAMRRTQWPGETQPIRPDFDPPRRRARLHYRHSCTARRIE